MDKKSRILMLVEGGKTDVKIMNHLISIYGIDASHEIVSYNTNIYTLYNEMFKDNDPDSMDLLQVLRSREKDLETKKLFDQSYSDILLVFDLDPQDSNYSEDKIREMIEYFKESTDTGKLYLNYPMVESFYHMKSIPDPDYFQVEATLEELKSGTYKSRVNRENRNHDYRKFARNRKECTHVVLQNIQKAQRIVHDEGECDLYIPRQIDLLNEQIMKLKNENKLFVLCTCVFFVCDYNKMLLEI